MTAHTGFQRGTRVLVHLKCGARFVDIFHDLQSRAVVLKGAGRIAKRRIRAMSIFRRKESDQ